MKSADLYGFATVKTDQADYTPGTTVTTLDAMGGTFADFGKQKAA